MGTASSEGSTTVCLADPIHPDAIARLQQSFRVLPLFAMLDEADCRSALAEAEVLIVRVLKTAGATMDASPRLRLIAKCGTGVDNIDVAAATERGIVVTNTPSSANATSVAEATIGLLLAVQRQICVMDAHVRRNEFARRWSVELHDLWGKSIGLVGFGQIARHVARICGVGFEMTVQAFDPMVPAGEMVRLGVTPAPDLEFMAAAVDVLSLHVPLTAATRHLVDARILARMRPQAVVVNTARGAVLDEAALAAALKEGRIAGAALDVFEEEPPRPDNPLFGLANVVLSPHLAGVTSGSVLRMSLATADAVEAVLAGRRPATVLNPEIWETRRR